MAMKIKESAEAALLLEHKFLSKVRVWLDENMHAGPVIEDAASLAINELWEAWVNCIGSNHYSNEQVSKDMITEIDEVIEELRRFKNKCREWL
jgi:hypothetical protein